MTHAVSALWGRVHRPNGWYRAQVHALEVTGSKVPWLSVHRPCALRVHGYTVEVFEILHRSLVGHDRLGRKRLAYCGAVIANLEAGIRALGWTTNTTIAAHPEEPDFVGAVSGVDRGPVNAHAQEQVSALHRGHHHGPVMPIAAGEAERLLARVDGDGVEFRVPREQEPAAMVVVTPRDSRRDAILAGLVTQRLWLQAAINRYVLSVEHTLLTDQARRVALRAELATPGIPQLVVHLGRSAG